MKTAEINRYLIRFGYLNGFEKLLRSKAVHPTPARIGQVRARLFKLLLSKIMEGKREINRLQTAIDQLETACRGGLDARRMENDAAYTAAAGRLASPLQDFDGWVISLFETDMALLSNIHNPATADGRIDSLSGSFTALWRQRMADEDGLVSHPDLFDLSIHID